jgi:HlyD family secretion protein
VNSQVDAAGRRKKQIATMVALGVVALALAAGYRLVARFVRPPAPDYPAHVVAEGPLTISVLDNASIESREKVVLKSQVEGRNTLVFLVDEGVTVKKGDLLVELDSSKLTEAENDQVIKVENAEAVLIQARESLAIATNQAESDVEKAELDLKFAQMDLRKYLEGDYPMELQKAESAITLAQSELKKSEDQLEWSQKLSEQGYVTRSELQADSLAVQRMKIDVETAQTTRGLLKDYTYARETESLQSAVKQAEMALDRVKRKARADIVKAEVDARAKDSEFTQQKNRLEKIREQIEHCKIFAPDSGMVVYATSSGDRMFRGSGEPLRVGTEVNEREELIYLPTTSAMNAELKVPESSLTKIHEGLRAFVTVDALPGRVFEGKLARIGLLPDTTRSWMNPDLKVYNCAVELDAGSADLRPGMSAKVEILVEEWRKALAVPVQCVLRVKGKPSVYVIGADGPKLRPVEVGLDNNVMIHVLSGVKEGEKVWLTPPLEQARQEHTSAAAAAAAGAGSTNRPAGGPASPERGGPAGAVPGGGERGMGRPGGGPEGRPAGAPGARSGERSGGRPDGARPEGARRREASP